MSTKSGCRGPFQITANTVLLDVATNSRTTVPDFRVTTFTLYGVFADEAAAVACEAVDAFISAAAFMTLEVTWGLEPVSGNPPSAATAAFAAKPMLTTAARPMNLHFDAFFPF